MWKKCQEKNPLTLGSGNLHIGVIDCGVKYNILRNLLREGIKITVLPYDYDFNNKGFDGIFISNGPGNPSMCSKTITNLQKYIDSPNYRPVFGICMGNQLLAIAAGGKTYKMKFGNRGHNQPVMNLESKTTYITSQNHGFAVDKDSLSDEWEEVFVNKNDNTNEGIRHKTKPFWSVQFHPEARGGPSDTEFMFGKFYKKCVEMKYGNIKKDRVLLLGSGGLSIGQAGEFDYSGSQAIKSFKRQNLEVVLVNPNIATIQTSEELAHKVYYLPVEPNVIRDILQKERPQYISLSFGGQTALNCGIELYKSGILHQYGVRVLGTSVDNILKTEDRDMFARAMNSIGEKVPISYPALSVKDTLEVANKIGYPVLCRAAFALGGLGSGFCDNKKQLKTLVEKTFTKTPQVLIDEDLRGWKEVEYEVIRDKYGNSITVCNMENFDPLGIHTGDSIVVAPSQTLTNDEYNMLRTASIQIAEHLEIIGECNVQFALDPHSSEYRVIEVNPRLSRSSALASKATGYPIAAVAAQLCMGKRLASIKNAVTEVTTANFEPSLDYIVVKIPRWDTRKFSSVDPKLGSAMKSVGEIMAIGRNFEEAFQKGLRMVGGNSFEPYGDIPTDKEIKQGLKHPTDDRVRLLAHALYNKGKNRLSVDKVCEITKIDKWFIHKLSNIVAMHRSLSNKTLDNVEPEHLKAGKKLGFSDYQLSNILNSSENQVRKYRNSHSILPKVKKIDTLAGEFPADTNYLYTTYNAFDDDISSEENCKTVIILGSGTYRIGSSVEFDYCSVRCTHTLKELGYNTIIVNCNPETISTDYDESDKLYFEELTLERVMDIYEKEKAFGIIVSMGGQEPNNIALKLHNNNVNILGTHATSIDFCENRSKYSSMLDELEIDQPKWMVATNEKDILNFVNNVTYPVIIRPSYVLSGAAMRIVNNKSELMKCIKDAENISSEYPVVITKFVEGAREVDLDAVCNKGKLITYAISEHVEDAGVHSGDATLVLPSYSISEKNKERMLNIVKSIGLRLNVSGLFNTQFLIKDDWIGVIETNLRCSRSIPFVSKTLGIDFVKLGTHSIMDVKNMKEIVPKEIKYFGVKCPQFSFARLPEADPILGVEMSSTGEVACFGKTVEEAYLKSLIASKAGVPKKDKLTILKIGDIDTSELEKRGHNINTTNKWKDIDMVIDCTQSIESKAQRRIAIDFSKFLITNKKQVELFARAYNTKMSILPYNKYNKNLKKRVIKLFVRQGFTESDPEKQQVLQNTLDSLANFKTENITCKLLTGTKAENKDTFKDTFEHTVGKKFTPDNFRSYRLDLLSKSDAMIIMRTSLSESTVFEVAYNIMQGGNVPIFFAIDPSALIKNHIIKRS